MSAAETPRLIRRSRLADIPHLQVAEIVPAQGVIAARKDCTSVTACGEEVASTLVMVTRAMTRVRCPRCLKAAAEAMTTAARDARIITAQSALLDYSGHVRPEIGPAWRQGLVREINALRAANGWEPLDMRGR